MSSLEISSATQLNGEDVDHEEVTPLQLHDHSYYEPPQVSADGKAVQESSEDIKPNLHELNRVKMEPISDDSMESDSSSSEFKTLHIAEMNATSSAVLGYIKNIPVKDVPYNVTHEDIAKALAVNDEKVAVRIMRKVIPCLRITAYMKEAEFVGKKKIKGLWATTPVDWPPHVPYKDPNNGEKIEGKLVPKANSEELRMMFKFLKNKVIMNIHANISQLSHEELEKLKSSGSATSGTGYYFSTPQSNPVVGEIPRTVRKHSPLVDRSLHQQYQLNKQQQRVVNSQPQVNRQVKQEAVAPSTTATAFVPTDQSIPVFVADNELGGSSPEQNVTSNSSPETSIEGQTLIQYLSDNSGDSFPEGQNLGTFYDETTGKYYYVQMPQDMLDVGSTGSSSDDMELEPQVIDQQLAQIQQVENTPPQPVQQQVRPSQPKQPVKRPSTLEPTDQQCQRGDGGKRLKEEISRGPIQQVSSPQQPECGEEVGEKRVLTTPQPVPTPQPFISHMLHSTALPAFPMPPVSGSLQSQQDYNRIRMLDGMHQRLKDKIMQLQGMVLGDEEITGALNRIYREVIKRHHDSAKLGHNNKFIDAAHGCEALLDRVLLDGTNYGKDIFCSDCNNLVEKYTIGPEDYQPTEKKTVLSVTGPDHPPVQIEEYARLQMKTSGLLSPSALNPKSPGTALSEKLENLDITSDPGQLGIRARGDTLDVMAMLQETSIVDPRKTSKKVVDENMLPLPEKLVALGLEDVETNQEAMDDLLKQLNKMADEYISDTGKESSEKPKCTSLIADSTGGVTQPVVESGQNEVDVANGQPHGLIRVQSQDVTAVPQEQELLLEEILQMENDYGVQGQPRRLSSEKTSRQASTPDDGFKSSGHGSKLTSFHQRNLHKQNKPYQRIQPKPAPSQIKADYGVIDLNSGIVTQCGQQPSASYGHFMPQQYNPVFTQDARQQLAVSTAATVSQQLAVSAPSTVYQQMAVSAPRVNTPQELVWQDLPNNSTVTDVPTSCIPEVVENFNNEVQYDHRSMEDPALRPRGRKRVHFD